MYSLEPPRRGCSNEYPHFMVLSKNKKNNVYPCKPQFYYIKVGFKGVKIIQACFCYGFFIKSVTATTFNLRRVCDQALFNLVHIVMVDTIKIQSNLDGSNTDGSFTMANSNSFLSPYEILPIFQENKYLRKFSNFIMKLYIACIH